MTMRMARTEMTMQMTRRSEKYVGEDGDDGNELTYWPAKTFHFDLQIVLVDMFFPQSCMKQLARRTQIITKYLQPQLLLYLD
mmetsp:Transcript_58830/g.143911  ORF Transcript_58830/g.143911 Transcript_58830/m.143911 type:complete len:82 (+) Transcript_58830:830-1075(+)